MKTIIISIVVVLVIILGALMLTSGKNSQSVVDEPANNVTIVDGKQIIEIKAKGGYSPYESIAKANMPTIIRFNTSGTFDCSSSIRIPKMNISENLPRSGSTDIDIGTQPTGLFEGTCGMGMYPFNIKFE